MVITLGQLETFLWVATLGSFRKTAEHLHTTQPAISARIANLEKALETKLFERESNPIRLTAKGQELLPYAEQVLRMADTLRQRASDRSRMAGILRLGVAETIVHTLLPTFLSRLHDKFPDVDVEITVDTTFNLRNGLVSRSLDLAFLMGPISEYSIENLHLASFPLAWVAAPALGVPCEGVVSLEDLLAFPLLTYARNTRPFVELNNRLRESAGKPPRIFPSSSLAACLRMTQDGIGVGTLPRTMIQEELENGSLIEIPCDWMPADLSFTASYSSDPFNPVVEQAVVLVCEIAIAMGYAESKPSVEPRVR